MRRVYGPLAGCKSPRIPIPLQRFCAKCQSGAPAGWDQLGLVVRDAIVDSVFVPSINPDGWVDNCASQISRERRATSPVSLQTIGVASGVFSGRGANPPTKQFGTLTASDTLTITDADTSGSRRLLYDGKRKRIRSYSPYYKGARAVCVRKRTLDE